jgi:DNA-directed RNA polymerase subunit RPC12/RpoP
MNKRCKECKAYLWFNPEIKPRELKCLFCGSKRLAKAKETPQPNKPRGF